MISKFYVTAIDGPAVYRLAGPYDSKPEADAKVAAAREIACDFSRNSQAGRAAFMAYGVSKVTAETAPRAALGAI